MLELQSKLFELTEENHLLRQRLLATQEQTSTANELEYHHNCYWRRITDDTLDGPYSMNEWDMNRRLVRLTNYGKSQYESYPVHMNFHHKGTGEDNHVPIGFLQKYNVIRQIPEKGDSQ